MLNTAKKYQVASWVTCILGGIVLLGTGLGIYLYESRFSIIYRDLGLAIPGMTEFLMWSSRSWAWVLLPLVSIIQVALELPFNGSLVRLWFNGVYLFTTLLVLACVIIAAFLPLVVTIGSISTQGSP